MTAQVSSNGYAMVPQPHGGSLQRWPKGVSGNPDGKKPRPITDLLKRCESKAEAKKLIDDYLELCHSKNQRVRLDALRDLFDRLWPQSKDGRDGPMRELIIREYSGWPEQIS